MNCKIQFIPEAVKDYASLDGSIKKLVNEKIEKLKENPFIRKSGLIPRGLPRLLTCNVNKDLVLSQTV